MKRFGVYSVLFFCFLIFSLLIFDLKLNLENELLLLILNSLFTGLIPIAVWGVAVNAFIRNGIPSALLMSSGMLMLGLGSIITGILMIARVSTNISLTIYNTCALAGGICHLIAAMREVSAIRKMKLIGRKVAAAASTTASFLLVGLLLVLALKGLTPLFIDQNESTQIRNIVLLLSVVFYFGASMAFMKQYNIARPNYLYWYSLSLLMLAIGLFAVSSLSVLGDAMTWVGRACQYAGAVYALLSMCSIMRKANKNNESLPDIMAEFFMNAESGYKNLIEALPEAVVSVDENDNIFLMNSAAKKLLWCGQLTKSKIFMDNYVSRQHQDMLRNDFHKYIEYGRSDLMGKTMQIYMRDIDGREFPAEISASVTKIRRGYISTYIIRDITKRTKMEYDLVRQADELYQKNKLITEFFINISHEFKTPLSILMLSTELLENAARRIDYDMNHIDKYLAMIKQNSNRLARLIANLIDLTKLDAGFIEPNWKTIDIIKAIKNLIILTQPYMIKKGLTVDFISSEQEKVMPTDIYLLDRIILNLLSNSIKYTAYGGRIEVNCSIRKAILSITVADNGEGIPDDKKDIIFDRFRQVNTSLIRSSEGCGIGLALTKGLSEKLGGRIYYAGKPSGGSRFCVELPILHVKESPNNVDYIGMQLDKRIAMEFSDIDF